MLNLAVCKETDRL